MADTIQAFFFGTSFGETVESKPVGLAGFAIPDLGVVYRIRCNGGIYECQYTGLQALLKFIEINRKQFKGSQFEILSDSALIVYQISHRKFITSELAPFYNSVISYKSRINYKVSWVPRQENIAITGLCETPPLNPDLKLNLDADLPTGSQSREQLSL